jgi:V8-like Glu-specific endopeptidase
MPTRLSSGRTSRLRRVAVTGALAIGAVSSTGALLVAAPSATAASTQSTVVSHTPAARHVSSAERTFVKRLDMAKVERTSKPAPLPANVPLTKNQRAEGPDGPRFSVRGTAPRVLSPTIALRPRTGATVATSNTGALWPGANTSNPNAQVGKLYFDTNPDPKVEQWSWCTGTAVNSENKSLVLTAGHCVWDTANRRWYTNAWFFPGYENGKTPNAAWPVRLQSTTWNYYNSGASADDMAIVLVTKDSSGTALVNRVGGHGIAFNQPVNQFRTAFGYPITDSRWPGWTSDGEDMYYCQGTDSYFSGGSFAGQMLLGCRMTGGASGGPWLTNAQSNWLGYAQSVNSNKGGIGSAWAGLMFGPYMGSEESAVFQSTRNS